MTDPAHPVNFVAQRVGPRTIDLMAALYVKSGTGSAFNSANMLQNLVMLNDDNTSAGSANPYPMFYINSSSTDCIIMSLVYFPWSRVPIPSRVNITASGPGNIATNCAALGPSGVSPAVQSQGNDPSRPAAGVIDAHPTLLALFGGLSTDAQRSGAVSQTLPLLTGGSMQAATGALTDINRVIQARIENNRGLSSGDDFSGDRYFWMKPFESWTDQQDSDGIAGYRARTYGTAVGVDMATQGRLRLGAALAIAHGAVTGSSTVAPQGVNVDVYELIGYGTYGLADGLDLNFQLDVGRNRNEGERVIGLTSTVASAGYDSDTAHVGFGIGRLYRLGGNATFTPSARIDYTLIRDHGDVESGAGALDLAVDGRTTSQLIVGADAKFTRTLGDQTTLIANAGVGYDTINRQAAISATYAGAPDAAFVTYGMTQSPWLARGGIGVMFKTQAGLEFTARYDVEYRESYLNQTASVKARWAF